jgi:prepilin-type N-terminal cleavage/methylation domain-containing protein
MKQESGFSLIEILVALTIMSFMMVSIYTIVDNNIDTKDVVLKEDREFLSVYTALSRIDRDLSQYYTPRYHTPIPTATTPAQGAPKPNTTPSYDQDPSQATLNIMPSSEFFPTATENYRPIPRFNRISKNEIMFMTTAHRRFIQGQKQSRYAWVKYFLRDPEDDELESGRGVKGAQNLYRQVISENIYDPRMDITQARETLILTGIERLLFLYWDIQKKDWIEFYDDQRAKAPPLGFRVEIDWKDDNGQEQKITKNIRPYTPLFDVTLDQVTNTPTTQGAPGDATSTAPSDQQGQGN